MSNSDEIRQEANASVYIDDSSRAFDERLELCLLRTEVFRDDAVAPEFRAFFRRALAVLQQLNRGTAAEKKALAENGAGNPAVENKEKTAADDTESLSDSGAKAPAAGDAEVLKAGDAEAAGLSGDTELCKLMDFWIGELESLIPPAAGGPLKELVYAWETTLQLLAEAEYSFADRTAVNGKEWRNIIYSYLYDYAGELLEENSRRIAAGLPVPGHFVTGLAETAAHTADRFASAEEFSEACSGQVRLGLELFFGDRLKARLLELMKTAEETENVSAAPAGDLVSGHEDAPADDQTARQNRTPADDQTARQKHIRECRLSSHQKNALAEFLRKTGALSLILLLCLTVSACGGKKEETETGEAVAETMPDYPGMVVHEDPEGKQTEYFGVMHATVLDVQEGEKDGLFVYTIRDKEDPDNVWSLNSQAVGSIFCEMNGGNKVTVLFSGDPAGDPDSVEFIAILDDDAYQIRFSEGTTVQNMMNSFVIRTAKGTEMTFIKDNCRIDKEALSTEGKSRVLVYYAGCGSGDLYPVRVYKLAGNDKR